jgi:hypothetical protein
MSLYGTAKKLHKILKRKYLRNQALGRFRVERDGLALVLAVWHLMLSVPKQQ